VRQSERRTDIKALRVAEFTQLKATQRWRFQRQHPAAKISAQRFRATTTPTKFCKQDNICPQQSATTLARCNSADQRTSLGDSQRQPAALSREQLNYPL
jgi:hypothetical protein